MDNETDEHNRACSPFFRLWLCGAFRMERRTATDYEAVPTAEWGGSNYPRLLLKALLCCPGRQARREALLELLWPDTDPEQAAQYLNTATTKLRKVLQPVKGQESLLITESDSTAYRLAPQADLWVDADEGLALLRDAERRGRTLPEALPLLERAAASFTQGAFLQDEEGQWVAGRRATVEQARYRCRLWLAEAYEQQGMPGQAETVLSLLLEEDPTDEDVLCRLMGVLHRQGMTHQALRLYQRSCELYAREGLELTEATKRLAEQLATCDRRIALPELLPASFSPAEKQHRVFSLLSQETSGQPPDQHIQELHESLHHRQQHGWYTAYTQQPYPASSLLLPLSGRDDAASSRFASTLTTESMETVCEQENSSMNLSRRSLLQQTLSMGNIALLSPSEEMLLSLLDRFSRALAKPSSIDETTLSYLEARTYAYWQDRQRATVASCDLLSYVWDHLQKMTMLLETSLLPGLRRRLCAMASIAAQLIGELLLDMGNYAQAKKFHETAVIAAQEGQLPSLEAIAWGRTSLGWIYLKKPQRGLPCIQQARHLARGTSRPSICAWLAAIEGEIQAMLFHPDACFQALAEAEQVETDPPFSDELALIHFDRSLLKGYQGACFRHLSQSGESQSTYLLRAQDALQEALTLLKPAFIHRQPTFLADLAEISLQQGTREVACQQAVAAATLASQIKLQKVMQRLFLLRQHLEPWKKTAAVQALDHAFLSCT